MFFTLRLKPRFVLFTITVMAMVVLLISVPTLVSFRRILRSEQQFTQITMFNNFKDVCQNALYLGDDLSIQAYSESLEESVIGLAFAAFVDHSRRNVELGGIESLHRYRRVKPTCPKSLSVFQEPTYFDVSEGYDRWRYYCGEISITNIQGKAIRGQIFLGFNMNLLDLRLEDVVSEMRKRLLFIVAFVFLVGLIISYLLAARITRPISHLMEGAKAIGDGKLDTTIPIESTDELGFLAQEFNLMASKLKELDNLKDDFISSVSHELRSPLSAISGYVELLRSKPIQDISDEKRGKALQIIHESTQRLTRFINDILDLAKLKSGQYAIVKKPTDIKLIAEDLVLLYTTLFEKKNIRSLIDIPTTMPLIPADDDKVRQVMTNLISNALKFTSPGGQIKIGAKNQGDNVQIFVSDNGIGIPDDSKEVVFERFKQVKGVPPQPGESKGTGLGLAIAKGIVESHGGRIWIESRLGKGTTVNFTLPLN